jgi:hypothetical protein
VGGSLSWERRRWPEDAIATAAKWSSEIRNSLFYSSLRALSAHSTPIAKSPLQDVLKDGTKFIYCTDGFREVINFQDMMLTLGFFMTARREYSAGKQVITSATRLVLKAAEKAD